MLFLFYLIFRILRNCDLLNIYLFWYRFFEELYELAVARLVFYLFISAPWSQFEQQGDL